MIEVLSSWIATLSYFVVPALGEGLWRGLLLALSAGILLSFLRFNASSRHTLWLFMLIAICAIPLFIPESKELPSSRMEFSTITRVNEFDEPESPFQIPVPVAAGIFGTIVFISLFRLALLARACIALSALRKKSTPAPLWVQDLLSECVSHARIKTPIQIRLSSRIEAPAVAGFFRPVVLFPEHLVDRLDAEETRHVLLHEIAHLKRHDDWAILIQRFLSAIFFFNPAVIWICKQMDLEREIACDDSVIETGGTPRSYALCLTRLAELSIVSRPLAGSTLLSASNQLSRRVDMLLNRSKKNRGMSTLSVICGVLLLSGLALWISQASPLLAVTESAQEPPRFVQAQESEIPSFADKEESELPTNPSKKTGFNIASRRMEQAQRKMEEAREEMLQAAEAMRQANEEMIECNGTIECEESDEMSIHALQDHLEHESIVHEETQEDVEDHVDSVHREHERVMRQVERNAIRNEKRKVIRVVPEIADLPREAREPREPREPRQPREPVVPRDVRPQLAPPSQIAPPPPNVEMPEQPEVPPTPERPLEPNFDFETDPLPDPELPDEPLRR